MNRVWSYGLVALFAPVLLAGCDKKAEAGETGSQDEQAAAGDTSEKAAGGGGDSKGCPGTNTVTLENLDKVTEKLTAKGPVEVKKAVGWMSGAQGSGKTSKHANVALANYEGFEIGRFGVEPPKQEGQIVVKLDFSSDMQEASVADQKKVYKTLKVEPGDYAPASMKPKSVDVFVYMGGVSGGYSLLPGSGHEGKAVLAEASDGTLCGTFDVKSSRGASAKGTFKVKIEKDLWE